MSSITADDVRAAIASIRAAGAEPTIRRIRLQLGNRGSMDRILALRREVLGEMPQRDSAPPTALVEAAQQLMPDVWRHATAAARAAVAAELSQAVEGAAQARAEADEIAALLAEQTARAETEADERRRLAEAVAAQAAASEAQRVAAAAEHAALCDRLAELPELRAAITGTAAGWQELIAAQERRFADERDRQARRLGEAVEQSRRDGEALSVAARDLAALQRTVADQAARIATLDMQAAHSAAALGEARAAQAAALAALEVERQRLADEQRARRTAEAAAQTAQLRAVGLEQRLDDVLLRLDGLSARHDDAVRAQADERQAVVQAAVAGCADLVLQVRRLAARLEPGP